MANGVIKTVDGVKDWFYLNGYKSFTLYRGHSNESSKRIVSFQGDSMEQAWVKCETALSWYGNKGDFYLFVTDSKNGTGGGMQTPIELYGSSNGGNDGAQINGVQSGYISIREAEMMRDNALMQARMEGLEARITGLANGGGSRELTGLEKVMEDVLKDEGSGKEVAIGIRDFLRGAGHGVGKLAAKVTDTPEQTPKRTQKLQQTEKETGNTEGSEKPKPKYDGRKIVAKGGIFDQTKEFFKEDEPQDVLAALINYYKDNPAMRGMLDEQIAPYLEKERKTKMS